MRKIIVLSFLSLDGVMQAPGGPKKTVLMALNLADGQLLSFMKPMQQQVK